VEWQEGKFSGKKGREALLQALEERKIILLARIARKKGMMRTVVDNFIPRRDRSGSKKRKGGK
jgi:hypothetical protein